MEADITPNGVFGAKVGGGYWNDFVRRLSSIDSMASPPLVEVLDALFPDLCYILLTRRSKVRQAVSHWMAIQSGRWRSVDAYSNRKPEYNFNAIDHLLQEFIFREAVWAEYFADNDIRPHEVTCEDFVQDTLSAVREILAFLNVAMRADFQPPQARYQPFTNKLSEVFVQRFRREKQADFWTEFW